MAREWTVFHNHVLTHAKENGIPVAGFFELTPRCNLQCKMCYIHGKKVTAEGELTAAQWIRIGEEARDAGLFFLTLTGGEILVRKDFFDIYGALAQMGFNITLYTNGTMIDSAVLEKLAKIPPSRVSITVYGSDSEMYGKVTGHPEAYDKTVNAIKMLISAGIAVQLKTTVIKDNQGEFEKLSEFFGGMGQSIGVVNYVSPRREGCGTDPENCRLSPYDLALYEKRVRDYNRMKREKQPQVEIDQDVMVDIKSEDIAANLEIKERTTPFTCSAGSYGFWMTWDGKLTPCGLLNEPYAKPLEIGFADAWKYIKDACEIVPKCNDCNRCDVRSYCMVCPGRLKTETGSFEKKASYLCDLANFRRDLGVTW